MTDKCLVAGLPAGGQKSLVICPQGIPATYQEQAALLAGRVRAVLAVSPGAMFGPDMRCPEAVMDLVADDPALAGNVTGLGRAHGGLAIDANGYTGYGLTIAVASAIAARTPPPRSATVQGFGAVGIPIAQALADLGVEIRGVSTVDGAIIAGVGGRPAGRDERRLGGRPAAAAAATLARSRASPRPGRAARTAR